MAELTGKTIAGRYYVTSFIGKGGMSEVYKVWDKTRSVYLAMKVLHPDLAEDKVFVRRFQREASALSKLQHPNIVRFYGLEKSEDLVFMLMDFIEGTTLRQEIFKAQNTFSGELILQIMKPICAALHYAHSLGIIHLDVKPSNIMIDNRGFVYVSDFGLARITESTLTTLVGAGTPAYMSPEQITGGNLSPQTDIYALGIVLFEMLTGGERPFTGENAKSGTISERVRWEKLKLSPSPPSTFNPTLTTNIDNIVLKCLELAPLSRYSSTIDLFSDLENQIKPRDFQSSQTQKPVILPKIKAEKEHVEKPSIWDFLKSLFRNKNWSQQRQQNALDESEASHGLMTENLLTAIDPNRKKQLIRLIGRDQELRIKDVIVNFGGGRYLLRGYKRFGGTSLIEQIIEAAKNDLSKKHTSNSAIMAVRLELPNIESPEDVVPALIREFRFETIRENFSKDLRKKLDKLSQEKHVKVSSSSDAHSVSFKVSPMPSLEASLSRKTDKEPQQAAVKLTDEMLFEVITNFLKETESKVGNKFEALLNRLIKSPNLPLRIVIVIDKIESPNIFHLLRQLRIFDNKSISIFAFVRQEIYLQWSAEIHDEISNSGFNNHYVPSLWEDQTHFVETMLRESFVLLPESPQLIEFRDHIAYITRGAPGDVVKAVLSHEYSEYHSGIPTLNLENIRDWEVIQYNAFRYKLLEKKWEQILDNQYIGKEECDQVRMGVYEFMDWADKVGGFCFTDASTFADTAKIKISESKIRRDGTLRLLFNVLTSAGYLSINGDEQFIVNRKAQNDSSSDESLIKG